MDPAENQPSGRFPGRPAARGHSRRLVYFPMVHTQADLGNLKEAVQRATLEKTGRAGWSRKQAAIEQLWTDIEQAIDALNLAFNRVRLYQDGLPVCGREAELVTALAEAGSRNHRLLLRLMAQGAALMGTESGELLTQEYKLARQSLGGRPPRAAALAARRQAASQGLLARRDQFIAGRINDTLEPGETGILFVGMLHDVARYLHQDIIVLYPRGRPRAIRRKDG